MAGDSFKKVQPGQRLEVTAEAFNAFLDAARAVREHKVFGTDASQFFRQSGIVKLKNASGADQGRFAVLGLTEPIILPAANEPEFKWQVTFEGVIPAKNDHKGKFAVLLEPIADGKIDLAVVAGVVPVRQQVDPAKLYDCAEIIDAEWIDPTTVTPSSASRQAVSSWRYPTARRNPRYLVTTKPAQSQSWGV